MTGPIPIPPPQTPYEMTDMQTQDLNTQDCSAMESPVFMNMNFKTSKILIINSSVHIFNFSSKEKLVLVKWVITLYEFEYHSAFQLYQLGSNFSHHPKQSNLGCILYFIHCCTEGQILVNCGQSCGHMQRRLMVLYLVCMQLPNHLLPKSRWQCPLIQGYK